FLFFFGTLGTAAASRIDEAIDANLGPIADALETIIFYSIPVAGQQLPLVLIALGGTAIFLTLYFGFINIRAFWL
ncbi:MAG: alanine glycine permease, partial [Akkermansiaceae bacterium]|nr:alanine glycine permease [Akkermansiaceae bacterium]